MAGTSRRDFLAGTASFGLAAAAGGLVRAQGGDGTERQVRPRHQGRRRARSEPVAARQARHRHPLRPDRGGRGRHPGRARAARARCRRQAGDAGPRRPALRTSFPTARRSAFRPTSWSRTSARRPACRRATPAPTTSPPSAATSSAQTRTRLYAFVHIANIGLAGVPGRRALQHRLRAGRCRGEGRSPRTPTWCSASRCACRRT